MSNTRPVSTTPPAGPQAQTSPRVTPATILSPGNSWYLIKRGLYYRANPAGYTADILEAGIFTEAEAESHVSSTAGEKSRDMRVRMQRVPAGKYATEVDLKTQLERVTSKLAEVRQNETRLMENETYLKGQNAALQRRAEEAEGLRKALENAAATLEDAARIFRLFGKPIAGEAMEIAAECTHQALAAKGEGKQHERD